ncbi:hypothetical protein CHUAL_004165 [Chamberlinius hualienensis]
MATHILGLKLIYRYHTLFCCLVIVWGIGIILGCIFLAAWGTAKKSESMTFPDVHVALKERAVVSRSNQKVLKALKYCSPLLSSSGSGDVGEGMAKFHAKI